MQAHHLSQGSTIILSLHVYDESMLTLLHCIMFFLGGGGADHLWQRYVTMDGPRGTVHSATDGPGRPSVVAMDGPGGPLVV